MKKIQILIISLVAILVLGCIAFVVLYFGTNIFKSNKDMFFKYLSQMELKEVVGDIEKDNYYVERKKSKAYSSEGKISINGKFAEEKIKENYTYTSYSDSKNKLAKSVVDINKDGEKELTIKYLKNEDLYAINFEDVIKQYIAVENNNLKEFFEKFGLRNTDSIPDKIESTEKIDEEALKQILSRYISLAMEQIPEDNYLKVKDEKIKIEGKTIEVDGYKLSIDLKTLQKIIIAVMDTLKEDEQVFNLVSSIVSESLNQELTFKQYQSFFDDAIEELKEEVEDNFNIIDIIVYKAGKNEVKVYAKFTVEEDDKVKLYVFAGLEKNKEKVIINLRAEDKNGEISNCKISKNIDTIEKEEYEFAITLIEKEEEIGNINILSIRDGKLDSDSIKNTIKAKLDIPKNNIDIDLEYNNVTNFNSKVEIDKIKEQECVIINDLSAEQIERVLELIANELTENVDLEVAEIACMMGVTLFSTEPEIIKVAPFMVVGTGISISTTLNEGLFNKAQEARDQNEFSTKLEKELIQDVQKASSDAVNEVSNQAKEMFNLKFKMYEGKQNGATAKTLVELVGANNYNNPEHLVETSKFTREIDKNKTYNISFETDSEGYINKVIIEE